jgi:hypothetical protein
MSEYRRTHGIREKAVHVSGREYVEQTKRRRVEEGVQTHLPQRIAPH